MSALAVVLVGTAAPVLAQDTLAETRLRKMEAEIRALQRQVFPGGDGKFFTPEIRQAPASPGAPGQPATTPVTDLLARVDSIESQIARLTAQVEQTSNRLTQLEARLPPAAPASDAAATSSPVTPAATANLSAMTGGASTPLPAPAPTATPAAARIAASASVPARGPSSGRLAAVGAIVKPQTSDAGEDEYSYGFRLWDAKFYPEAQQQLKLFVEKYPRHDRMSYARNLLGRAYLDEGKPREAATWFLQNYQSQKTGARAPDSLLYLAESMRQLKDTTRACIALAEFSETYAAEAAGRLKSEYDATRAGVKCN